jgi:hypothetical protein
MTNNTSTDKKFKSLVGRKRTADLGISYVDQHFGNRYIFPIKPGAKFPPLIKNNLEDASNDPVQIAAWEAKWPGCSWGLSHRKSGMMVADVDINPAKGKVGQATFDELEEFFGWPATEMTTTPSGGFHLIYEGLPGLPIPMALGENGLGKDIDVPNYTLIPGCTFDDGTAYVSNGADAVACPQWIYDTIKMAKTKSRVTDAGEVVIELDQQSNIDIAIDFLLNDAEPGIAGQGGDINLLKTAYYLKDLGISQQLGAELLSEHYNPRCEPPWDTADLEKKMAGAYMYANLSKVGGKTAEADFADEPPEPPVEPMGIYDIETKSYKKNPEKLAKAKRKREKDQAAEVAKKPDERDRVWSRQEVINEVVYVSTLNRFFNRNDPATVWSVEGFNNKFGYLSRDGKLSKSLFASKKNTIRKPDRMVYRPTLPQFVDGCWNQWRPSTVVAEQGDTSLWDAHLAYLFPDQVERDHLLNWLAGVLQQQQVKPMHALLLVGKVAGTGKSFVVRVLAALIGESNWQALTQDILANGFTGWATRTKLVTVEELRAVQKTEISKKLHPWITQREMTVNEKNLPTFVIDQCIAFAFMSNKPDAIEIDNTDRRYLVLETVAAVHKLGTAYYQKLYGKNDIGGLIRDRAGLAAILWALMNRPLGKYDIAGPAQWTDAKTAMKAASANDIAQWMHQNSAQPPFCHRVVTMDEIAAALPSFMRGRITMKGLREALEHFGGLSWPTQIEPDSRSGGETRNRLRVWLLGSAADEWRKGVSIPKVTEMYREDHGGPRVIAIKSRTLGDGYDAMTDFGSALEDFAGEPDEPRIIN